MKILSLVPLWIAFVQLACMSPTGFAAEDNTFSGRPAGARTSENDVRPNMVFIMADDCTFRDIGCYGGQAHTPNIDALAKQGMRFKQCFQTAPMCSPTRHNIYTGLGPVKSGAYPNHTFAKPQTKSIVHYLRPLGYRVALYGKRHIGPQAVFPFESGKGKGLALDEMDKMFGECVDSETPFCLFACSNEPHTPWNKGDASRYPPDEVKLPVYLADTKETRADFSKYLAEITYFDGQVGSILKLLDKHKLAENTLVMVVSEQGNSFPFAKWTCYDSGLQSIMVVRWPGHVKPASETSALVEYVDVCPTFVEVAGGKPSSKLDGQSLLPVLRGETDQHKTHVYGLMTTRGIISGSSAYPIRSVRSERFKLIHNLNWKERFENIVVHGNKQQFYKSWRAAAKAGDKKAQALVHRYEHRPEFELFDIQKDPLELKNLADDPAYEKELASLREKLAAWMKSQGDQGMATELAAFDRQKRGKKKPKPAAK